MKKILLFPLFCFFAFQSCIVDTEYTLVCDYTNNTQWTLDVVSSSPDPEIVSSSNVRQEIYTLAPGESHTITLSRMGSYPDALHLKGTNTKDKNSTTVSNGESIVVCYESEGCDLYNLEKYKFISEKNDVKRYEYIFETGFFDNAEPIE